VNGRLAASAARALTRPRAGLALGATAAIAGFGLVTLGFSISAVRRADVPRRTQLIGLIDARKRQVDDLDAAVRALRSEVDQAQAAAGRLTTTEQQQASIEDQLSLQAGSTAMSGPALVVQLADSSRHPTDLAQASAYRVHDADLQLVVNALFAAGAEAVAVNSNRVVATTPIRGAGQTIVVNFRPLNPPYVVQGIGADRNAFEGSDIARRFHRWTTLFGLTFNVSTSDRVVLPGFNGQLALTTATPTQLLGPLAAQDAATTTSSPPNGPSTSTAAGPSGG
jgi:uncharacterized protein YlxW (UPF0749 family)